MVHRMSPEPEIQWRKNRTPQRPIMSHFDVSDFASQLDKETVKKAVKDIISRAGCCLDNGGSAFESKLKAYKRTG